MKLLFSFTDVAVVEESDVTCPSSHLVLLSSVPVPQQTSHSYDSNYSSSDTWVPHTHFTGSGMRMCPTTDVQGTCQPAGRGGVWCPHCLLPVARVAEIQPDGILPDWILNYHLK